MAIAWVSGLLILSNLPDILFRTATGARTSPVWLPGLELLLLVVMLATVALWSPVHRLRGYVLALVGLGAGYLVESVVEHSSPWISWNQSLSPGISFVLINSAKLIPVTTLSATLIGSSLSREDLFLAIGDFRARFMRIGLRTSLSWGWLLPIALLLSVVPVVANVVGARHPDLGSAGRLLPLVPLILAGAAINTFSEEFLFRQVLLARLIPALGVTQAIWLTALRFGVGHWFGNPSGPTGVLLATVFGWFAARSMLDTRGSGWIWVVHLINDIVIFSLIALTTARWA
ncbi:MAG TPA: CPBP family intramembrane glutamic endopeptidase [Candidatus Dormibacteraeota bacterium]|nr:CPBP family intramembrane glutamic endopeptidase [Candidatus Dormibacteraeota bacterium]